MTRKVILRRVIYGLVVFILMALQSSRVLAIADINPDILLIVVILHSLYYGDFSGVIFGFSVGLLEDVFSAELFGLNAFVLSLLSFLTGVYKKYIFISDIVAFLLYIVLATLLKYLLYHVFQWIFIHGSGFDWMTLLELAGELAYNSVIGLGLFYLAPLIYKKEENLY